MSIFQSTLPHGSDDEDGLSIVPLMHFNPRSLTGATLVFYRSFFPVKTISIHAPSRERRDASLTISSLSNFNPRSLTGATHFNYIHFNYIKFQSTLPHGSDITIRPKPLQSRNFNPRSLTGATSTATGINLIISLFQSTLPHGSDAARHAATVANQHFNPRSLTGATRADLTYQQGINISIHAPSRERRSCPWLWYFFYDFNPRSLTGATASLSMGNGRYAFQSTLPHGSDKSRPLSVNVKLSFQSTLPHGSDNPA